MRPLRWTCSMIVLLSASCLAHAQFIPQPVYYPVPVYYPFVPQSGFGMYYQSGGFRVGGFLPFAAPYASYSNNVSITVVTPTTYVIPSRRFVAVEDFYDVAGIDLDARPVANNARVGIAGRQERKEPERAAEPVAAKPPPPAAKVPEPPAPAPKKEPPPPLPPDLPPPAHNAHDENARLTELGRKAFRERLFGLAAMRFRQALDVVPFDAQGHFLLAQAQFASGRFRDAAETIEAGMRLRPDWPATAFPLRELYKNVEDHLDGSIRQLQDTVARHPQNATYRFLLGHQLWFDGRRVEAVEQFRLARASAADPTFIDAFLKQAKIVAAK